MQHILSASQFNREMLDEYLKRAEIMERVAAQGGSDDLKGKILATLFFEPSTRTRLSFETAILKLGGQVISQESASVSSSAAKGETIEDTIRIVNGYADAIVLRHPEMGTAERAARVSEVPLINAGDGPGEHPTQSLLDLFTIQKELGHIDNIHIAFVGDLKYGRTVRSLARFLTNYTNVNMTFVSPVPLRLGDDIKKILAEHRVSFSETENLNEIITNIDILYMTRVQQERFSDKSEYERLKNSYVLTADLVGNMKQSARILHPLPRVNEIAPEVDRDPRAAYFRQARNGLYVRMALLHTIIKGK
ncbi:MAG: aspartate carbamoyltransferase [Patescibacteria group bacterium]